jgi:hypothetical protein
LVTLNFLNFGPNLGLIVTKLRSRILNTMGYYVAEPVMRVATAPLTSKLIPLQPHPKLILDNLRLTKTLQ